MHKEEVPPWVVVTGRWEWGSKCCTQFNCPVLMRSKGAPKITEQCGSIVISNSLGKLWMSDFQISFAHLEYFHVVGILKITEKLWKHNVLLWLVLFFISFTFLHRSLHVFMHIHKIYIKTDMHINTFIYIKHVYNMKVRDYWVFDRMIGN